MLGLVPSIYRRLFLLAIVDPRHKAEDDVGAGEEVYQQAETGLRRYPTVARIGRMRYQGA
jgi:hypothetical protein